MNKIIENFIDGTLIGVGFALLLAAAALFITIVNSIF